MISETEFARQYVSVWRTLTPMSEQFIRRVNGAWYEQVFAPIPSRLLPFRRALRNEIAFRVFISDMEVNSRAENPLISNEAVEQVFQELRGDERWKRLQLEFPLIEAEKKEIEVLWWRLIQFFFQEPLEPTITFPAFKGCGLIDNCFGDIIRGDTLYEVKAGGRLFRSIDLRQLLVYSSLDKQAGTYGFVKVGVFNPRVGICYRSSLSEICYEVSGKGADELLADIIEAASAGDISR